MDNGTLIAWVLMASQMAGWAWHQHRGGKLADREYLAFCGMMMLGQIGAGIECYGSRAWGTLAVQAYFFAFTLYGAWRRFGTMRP